MAIRDIFDIGGRGIVVVGTIESGTVHVGGRPTLVSQTANMRVEVGEYREV